MLEIPNEHRIGRLIHAATAAGDCAALLVAEVQRLCWKAAVARLGSEDAVQVAMIGLWRTLAGLERQALVERFGNDVRNVLGYFWRSASRARLRELQRESARREADLSGAEPGTGRWTYSCAAERPSVETSDRLARLWVTIGDAERRDLLLSLAHALRGVPVTDLQQGGVLRLLATDRTFATQIASLFATEDLRPLDPRTFGRSESGMAWSRATVGSGLVKGENLMRSALDVPPRAPRRPNGFRTSSTSSPHKRPPRSALR